MKRIKYKVSTEFNIGTEEDPQYKTFFADRAMFPVTKENIETVKAIAYNGEYTIEDDGEPELPTTEQRVSDLEEQIAQADETAISLYEAQEAQEVINAQQDEALMEIYEMIG